MFDEVFGELFSGMQYCTEPWPPYTMFFTHNVSWGERLYSQCYEDYKKFHDIYTGETAKEFTQLIKEFVGFLLN